MKTVQSIAFDFSTPGITPRIYGKQGDVRARQVEISLYDRGNAWSVPNDALLALRYKLPSGASGLYDAVDDDLAMTVSENVVLVTLATPIFAEAGTTSCELVIADADGGLSTWTFFTQVEASSTGSADVPEDYYNAFLSVAAQTAAAVAKAESAAARAEEAAESVDANSLMSKTMYDPEGAVEAAGGIPKFVLDKTLQFEKYSCSFNIQSENHSLVSATYISEALKNIALLKFKLVINHDSDETNLSSIHLVVSGFPLEPESAINFGCLFTLNDLSRKKLGQAYSTSFSNSVNISVCDAVKMGDDNTPKFRLWFNPSNEDYIAKNGDQTLISGSVIIFV